MRRVFLLLLALLWAAPVTAQYYYNPLFVVMPGGATLPPTCTSGDRYFLTSDSGVYVCGGNNVWAKVATAISAEMASSAAWGGITGTLSAQTDLQAGLDAKQATLVSATNIKTINGSTVLGSGDLVVAGAAAWGSVTGTLADQTDLQTALDGKASTAHAATHLSGGSDPLAAATTVARGTVELATDGESAASVAVQGNDARMSNARTPTAHATSHVTGGSDIIANAVAAGNAGLLTGADKTKLDATSGTNTGDQTSIVGITGTLAQFNTALTSADFASGGGTATGTNTGDQTSIVGITGTLAQFNTAITDADLATGGGTATGTNTGDQTITLTGNVTGTGTGSFAATIANSAVTLAKQADMASASLVYRKTGGAGAPEVNTLATLKTDLGLTGTNSGDQTITLTGDVTGTGTGSFAATIANSAVTLAKMANMATASLIYRKTGSAGAPEVNSLATLSTDLLLPTTLTSTTLQSDAVIATYTAITGLSFTPAASTKYLMDCFIRYTSTATTTGINFAWDVPAAVTSINMSGYTTTTALGANEGFSQRADNVGTATSASVITVENVAVLQAQLVNGANATSTSLGFTPETANSVSVLVGSTCRVRVYP